MPPFTGYISEARKQCPGRVNVIRGKYVFVATIGVTQLAVDNGECGNTMRALNPWCTCPRVSLEVIFEMRRTVWDGFGYKPWFLIAWYTEQSPP